MDRLYLSLIPFFRSRNLEVTLLLDTDYGALMNNVPQDIRIYVFREKRFTKTFPKLLRYIEKERPNIILTAHKHKSIIVNWALALKRCGTKHVATLHMPPNPAKKVDRSIANLSLPLLTQFFLKFADKIVAVSNGIADVYYPRYLKTRPEVIENGIVDSYFLQSYKQPSDHPWLADGRKTSTFVAVGRLEQQKDFRTLIHAFAYFRKSSEGKLVIFGEGPQRSELESLASELGVASDIDMPGFKIEILPHIHAANALVSSSIFEAFPLSLTEALACGTPIVSTNCPYGPSEVLLDGKYGRLVSVGNWHDLSNAMKASLRDQRVPETLHQERFSAKTCSEKYLKIFESLL